MVLETCHLIQGVHEKNYDRKSDIVVGGNTLHKPTLNLAYLESQLPAINNKNRPGPTSGKPAIVLGVLIAKLRILQQLAGSIRSRMSEQRG